LTSYATYSFHGVHKAQTGKNIAKPQWKDIGILPTDSIHTIRRTKFVSNRIYEVACLVQVAINVFRYSPCCYIVLTVTLTFSPSVHVVYRFPMPQGLHCAEEVQRWKGIIKKLSEQKNGGRKGLRRHLEQSS